jgi:hypothetical protein
MRGVLSSLVDVIFLREWMAYLLSQSFLITAYSFQVVDGKLSQTCYLMALDSCYRQFCNK